MEELLFLPSQLTDGIEQSDDRLIDIRSAADASVVLLAQSMIGRTAKDDRKLMAGRGAT